jgi:hypothetical protein
VYLVHPHSVLNNPRLTPAAADRVFVAAISIGRPKANRLAEDEEAFVVMAPAALEELQAEVEARVATDARG